MRLILWNAALRSSVVACGREGNGRGDGRQEIDEAWIARRCQSLSRLGFRISRGWAREFDGRAPSP